MKFDDLTLEDLKNFSASYFEKIPKNILNNLLKQEMDQFPSHTFDSDRIMWDD